IKNTTLSVFDLVRLEKTYRAPNLINVFERIGDISSKAYIFLCTIKNSSDTEQATHISRWMNQNIEELNKISNRSLFSSPVSFSLLQLSYLPEEICYLIQLKELDLDVNKLTSLPVEIGNLILLERFDLSCNKLTSLPKEIGNLTLLQKLDLK